MTTTNEALVKAQNTVQRHEKSVVKLLEKIEEEIGVKFEFETITEKAINDYRHENWLSLNIDQRYLLGDLRNKLDDLERSKEKLKKREHINKKIELKENKEKEKQENINNLPQNIKDFLRQLNIKLVKQS